MPLPTPAEQQAIYPSTFTDDLNAILSAMYAKGYDQLASEFSAFAETFHAQHPTATAQQALQAFLDTALGKALAKNIGGTGKLLGELPAAAAKGAENAYAKLSPLAAVGDFLSRLTSANTWLRVAEVLLGTALIIVALAKLAGDTPIGRTAAKVGKAAMIL